MNDEEYKLWLELLKWIKEEFLNPSKRFSGYLEIKLKDGKPEQFTIRVPPTPTWLWDVEYFKTEEKK